MPYVDPGDGLVYRCLTSAPTHPEAGELFASRMCLGSYQGDGRGVKNPNLTRRGDSKPTMTYTRFYSLGAPKDKSDRGAPPGMYSITKEQLKGVIKMMDEMYEIAGSAHFLTDPEAVRSSKGTKASGGRFSVLLASRPTW